ncbi:unnamed protein product, partial [Mesorhabditis belari]|uniref:Uncharacterized protein n=1 Tax=Mesorhabditis belari TaxID=2138241 RepID=A0AAF3FLE7_9BILA
MTYKYLSICLLLIFFFCEKFCGAEKTIFELNPKNPSFAIHGATLARSKKITIIGCDECDFLMDFTQRDCQNEPDDVQISYKSKIARNFTDYCLDSWPFLIDGIEPTMLCGNPMPYTSDLIKQLYPCSMRLEQKRAVIVEAKEGHTEFVDVQYALSFRVSKWINESQKAFVVPASFSTYIPEMVLIPKDYVGIVVTNGDLSRLDGPFVMMYPSAGSRLVAQCNNLKEDITCIDSARYSMFFGSAPGLAQNVDNHLMDIGVNRNAFSRALSNLDSFESILLLLPCKELLNIGYADQLDNSTVTTSLNFPWELDDPTQFPDAQWFLSRFSAVIESSMRMLIIRVDKLHGGTLQLLGSRGAEKTCNVGDYTQNVSFTEPTNEEIRWKLDCLWIIWRPKQPMNDSFGFVLRTKRDPDIFPDDVVCAKSFYLTKDQPHFILHAINVQYARTDSSDNENGTSLCVRHQWCKMDEDCRFLVDLPITCSHDEAKKLSKTSPIQINGQYPDLENCTVRYSSRSDDKVFITCQTIIQASFVAFRVRNIQNIRGSAVSVRAIKWIDDPLDSFVIASDFVTSKGSPNTTHLSMKVPPFDRPFWISFAFPWNSHQSVKRLEKLRLDHNNSRCEYRLVSGPPLYNECHKERELMLFSDLDPFIPQFVETLLVSVLIPSGCAPSLSLVQTLDFLSFNRSIDLCAGQIMMESLGYQNPFEFPIEKTFNSIEYRITCKSYRVNVEIEELWLDGSSTLIPQCNWMGVFC